jgi:hypothetical protein
MENAAAAGRAQIREAGISEHPTGAILVNLRGLTPQAVHPGAEPLLVAPKTRLNPGKMADPGGWINPPWTTGDPAPRLLYSEL